MKETTQTYATVKISELALHRAIPIALRVAFSSVTHTLGHSTITPKGIRVLAESHPPLAIINAHGKASCIRGLRTYQLVKTYLPHDTSIPILICSELAPVDIRNIAITDTYLTLLAFGLNKRSWPLDVLKFWAMMSKEAIKQYTPSLTTKTRLSELMKISRQRLSPKFKSVTSKLKQIGK